MLENLSAPAWQSVPLPDADIRFLHPCPMPAAFELDSLMRRLQNEVDWRSEPITLWGRTVMQPRLMAWVGDQEARYTYSGLRLTPQPWSELLAALRAHIGTLCQTRFNSALLNYYRDGHDHMGLHSDDEPELGPEPVIASLSLGATRQFFLRHKTRRDAPKIQFALTHGHLLLMQGATQRCWKHGIRKMTGVQAAAIGPRINLTFRTIHPAS